MSDSETKLAAARQMIGTLDHGDAKIIVGKSVLATVGAAASWLTLNEWVAVATLVYIVLQIFFLIREKWYLPRQRAKRAANGTA